MVRFFQAKVFHKRIDPHNTFCYKAGYILFPLVGKVSKPKFFSIDRFNLFTFYNKDHGYKNGKPTLNWVYEKLQEKGIEKGEVSQIMLLTHPRCFSFVFNPVSFYFCLNQNHKPVAIIAEVNNTFSQTHSYIICEDNFAPINSNKIYKTSKEFFVSPFFQTEGHYEFRFSYLENKPAESRIAVFINYFKEGELAFETSLSGKVVHFTVRNSMPYLFTTFKTVILIGFQAFVLKFIKKLRFRRPTKTDQDQTKYY